MSTALLLDDLTRLREQASSAPEPTRTYLVEECRAQIAAARLRGTIDDLEAAQLLEDIGGAS